MPSEEALVISHTDGHGACAGSVSKKNLEKEGYETEIFSKFPDTGVVTKFWTETINQVNPDYDTIVIVDIPIDLNNPKLCQKGLMELAMKKGADLYFIDHHPSLVSLEDLRNYCIPRMMPNAYRTCYGFPREPWSTIGAICDRDPQEIKEKISKEKLEIADGLDVAVREDVSNALQKILNNDTEYFKNLSGKIPKAKSWKVYGDKILVSGVEDRWRFKILDRVLRTEPDCTYAICLSENVPDRVTNEPVDLLSVVKYWLKDKLPGTAKDLVPNSLMQYVHGHPNAITITLPAGQGKKYLEMVYGN